VACVIINRYLSLQFPNDWIGVVSQENQFAGYIVGKTKYENGSIDSITWDYAYFISGLMVIDDFDSIDYPNGFTEDYLYFVSAQSATRSNWQDVIIIGGNKFYHK